MSRSSWAVLLVPAVLVATLLRVPAGSASDAAARPTGIDGPGVSEIIVANLDDAVPATVVGDFYNQRGSPPTAIELASKLAPQGTVFVPLEVRTELDFGAYAATVDGDRDIGTLVTTRWPERGAAASYEGAKESTDVLVPLVLKGADGHTSIVTIQNTDPNDIAGVRVELAPVGKTTPTKVLTLTIPNGTSTTVALAYDAGLLDVPSGFVGAMRVTAPGPIAVQSFVDIEPSPAGVYAFNGLPTEDAASRLLAPVVHAGWFGPDGAVRDTRIALMNPASIAVSVTVTFAGHGGSCAGRSFTQGPLEIAAGTSLVLDQAPGGAGPSASPLPAACEASAVIEAAGGGVVGTVVDLAPAGARAGAYNLLPEGGARRRMTVARYRRAAEGTTAIYAMNADAARPISATLALYDEHGQPVDGCGDPCTIRIGPGAAGRWWMADIDAIPDGSIGHAVVASDGFFALVGVDEPDGGRWDLTMAAGLAADEEAGAGPPGATATPPFRFSGLSHIPILLRENCPPFRTPSPPSPTETAAATPGPTATPVAPGQGPMLELPASVPASIGGAIEVPLTFDPAGAAVQAISFTLEVDTRWVTFDPTSTEGHAGGMPNGLVLLQPGLDAWYRYVTEGDAAMLRFTMIAPGGAVGGGPLLLVRLGVRARPPVGEAVIRFAADEPPAFRDARGEPLAGGAWSGGTELSEARTSTIYLPKGERSQPWSLP